MQTDQIVEQDRKIERLNSQIDTYLDRYANQQVLLLGSVAVLVLLTILLVLLFRAYRGKNNLNRELSRRNNEITVQKEQLAKRNEEITTQKEQLEHQRDQLVALSEELEEAIHAKLVFFTNVSHDFRTPLTLIADPVEQLLNDPALLPPQRRLLLLVRKNIAILLRLVNQILDFRKYENGKLNMTYERRDLKLCIQEWNRSFQPSISKKHIHFLYSYQESKTGYQVDMDVEKIERVYFNLLSNALKYTPENGKITIALSTFTAESDRSYVRLQIEDTGTGISSQHIQHIFDRFYKPDVHHTGSGIGLALVKAFVEMHHGSIRVDSCGGTGSVFTVELPVVHPQQAPAKTPDTVLSESATFSLTSGIKSEIAFATDLPFSDTDAACCEKNDTTDKPIVLVIDDNADIRSYIRLLLQEKYAVLQAAEGQAGLHLAMKYVPDLVISDVMMPGMDGVEVCKVLKNGLQTSHIPVILLTACSLDEQRIQGFENGADSYIAKPFNSSVLAARIHNLIDGRKRLQQFFGDNRTLTKESISDMDKGFIEKFRRLIDNHLGEADLNIEDLGKNMGLSRVQLYRKVKSLTNYAPNELLRIARLKKASSLLASSAMTVAEIAYEVGFTSPSYFTKCYKEHFGESPSDFLRKIGKKE